MDAIKSVENEVDKVLRLFATCRESCNSKIDQLIESVEKAKQEIDRLSTRKYPNGVSITQNGPSIDD
jgi:translation initiation factor 2B subunit (eIF-2B alpha/beta/delta family)